MKRDKPRPKAKVHKMALIGTQRVGKTSLLTKLHFGTFEKNTIATVGASFILHTFKVNGDDISFQIWDTAGQERYRSLAPIYYRDASCAIAVFDLSVPQSFQEMKIYIEQFKTHCANYNHIAVIGNKLDIYQTQTENKMDISSIEKWAKQEGFSFHLTSASTGEGVNDAFQNIAESVTAKFSPNGYNEGQNLEEKGNRGSMCC